MSRRGQPKYSISLQAVQPVLKNNVGEEAIGADLTVCVEAYFVGGLEREYGPGPVVDLEYVKVFVDLERARVSMNERLRARARVAIRCLYPEPGAARVEYELVRLSLAAEVHC